MPPEEEPPKTEQQTDPGPSDRMKQLSRIATERLGAKYHGGIISSQDDEPKDDKDEPPDDQDAKPDDSEQKLESEGDAGEDETEEDEEKQISRWSDLIETQEWDPEWAQGLRMPVKIDGKEGEVAMRDLIDSYEPQEAAKRRLAEAKEQAKTTIEQAEAVAAQVQQQQEQAKALLKRVEEQFEAETGQIDWKQLKEDDPAEFAARKTEIAERKEAIQRLKQEAEETGKRQLEEQSQVYRQKLAEHLQAEREKLVQAMPEFADKEKGQAHVANLLKYIGSYGATSEDIEKIHDHRVLVFAEKARRYDEMMSKRGTSKKKIAAVPKVMRPGASKEVDNSGLKKSEQRFNKNPTLESGLELLKARRAKRNSA